MNITKEQWEEIVRQILQFNRLVTDEQERNSEEYILKCYNLVDEEVEELLDAEEGSVEELDAIGDVLVTGIQLIDAMTPSQLQWECVSKYLDYTISPPLKEYLLWYIISTVLDAMQEGYDLYGAMCEINKSNMSKVVNYQELNLRGDDWEKEAFVIESRSSGRYKGVTYSIKGGYVIFRDSNKKVMKPWTYKSPNLTPYMNKQ